MYFHTKRKHQHLTFQRNGAINTRNNCFNFLSKCSGYWVMRYHSLHFDVNIKLQDITQRKYILQEGLPIQFNRWRASISFSPNTFLITMLVMGREVDSRKILLKIKCSSVDVELLLILKMFYWFSLTFTAYIGTFIFLHLSNIKF